MKKESGDPGVHSKQTSFLVTAKRSICTRCFSSFIDSARELSKRGTAGERINKEKDRTLRVALYPCSIRPQRTPFGLARRLDRHRLWHAFPVRNQTASKGNSRSLCPAVMSHTNRLLYPWPTLPRHGRIRCLNNRGHRNTSIFVACERTAFCDSTATVIGRWNPSFSHFGANHQKLRRNVHRRRQLLNAR